MTPALPPPQIEIHGDLRLRGDVDAGADLRLRAHPELRMGQELELHAIADVRATSDGPKAGVVPVAAWGVLHTPVGDLSVGRSPMPMWGLGLVANPGGCLNCVSDHTVDRIGFGTELAGHVLGLAADTGDGITTATLTAGRLPTDLQRRRHLDAGHGIWGYGLWSTWRGRSRDALRIGLADGWLRYEKGRARIEVEGVFAGGRIGQPQSPDPSLSLPPVYVQQGGGAAQLAWGPLSVEAGFASGDRAPGRGITDPESQVDPPHDQAWTNLVLADNHFVDRLQFRRQIGAISDAAWVHPAITVQPDERLVLQGWFTWSHTLVNAEPLQPELGASVRYNAWRSLHIRMDGAYLVGAGGLVEGNLAWVY